MPATVLADRLAQRAPEPLTARGRPAKPFWASLPLLLLLGLAACQEELVPPPIFKDIRPVPRMFSEAQVGSRRVDGLSIKIYNTGSVVAPGGAVSSVKSWRVKTRLDIPVFLISHPTRGLILFDTGLHPDMETMPKKKMGRINYFFVPFKAGPGQNIAAQLKADGVALEDIKTVVISHYHLDHYGMMDAFPKARIMMDRREWESVKALKAAGDLQSFDDDPDAMEKRVRLELVDVSSGPAFGSFDHAVDLFGDGTLFLVDLAGHTAGNMGAWVNLDSGPVLITGDASWITDNHEDLALPITAHIYDLRQYWRRLIMMKAMKNAVPGLVIYPGHDLSPLKYDPRPEVELVPFPR